VHSRPADELAVVRENPTAPQHAAELRVVFGRSFSSRGGLQFLSVARAIDSRINNRNSIGEQALQR